MDDLAAVQNLNRHSDTNLNSVSPNRRAGMEKTGTRKNRLHWCGNDVVSPYSPESARSGGLKRFGEHLPPGRVYFPCPSGGMVCGKEIGFLQEQVRVPGLPRPQGGRIRQDPVTTTEKRVPWTGFSALPVHNK